MNERIELLRQQGYDTSWYEKRSPHELRTDPEKCGYFTMYRLEGGTAFTIERDGSKYLEYRALSKPVAEACWYCQACKSKFYAWREAKVHREVSL